MGTEREEFRQLQKTHSECDEAALAAKKELQAHRAEIAHMRDAQEQRAMQLKPWEEKEEAAASRLRSALHASEAREQQLQNALNAEKLSGCAAAERLRDSLRKHEDGERSAKEALAAAQDRELRFAELRNEVSTLSASCLAKEEMLSFRTSAFDDLQTEYAECRASRDALRREVDSYKDDMRASEEKAMERRVSEFRAESEEARQQAALMRKGEATAKASAKALEKRLKDAEAAQAEGRATIQARDKEMQELQARNTKSATKKEAEVRLLQGQLEQSKTEIAELYDALVRASENTKTTSKKSVK